MLSVFEEIGPAAVRNPLTWVRSLFDRQPAKRDLSEIDVHGFVASVHEQTPDFTLPKGAAPHGLYLGGVWLSEPDSPVEIGVIRDALIFYGEAWYKQLLYVREADGRELVTVRGFIYSLSGDQIVQEQVPEDWGALVPGDGPAAPAADPSGPAEQVSLPWLYANGRLHIKDGPWHRYRPSGLAELVAEGFPGGIVNFIHTLALLGDPDFAERVEALPLRSAG